MTFEVLSYAALASRLALSVRTLRRKLAAGTIPARRVGKRALAVDWPAVWAALPSAAAGRSRGLPPSILGRRRPIEQVLTEQARHCYDVPDELAIRRAQKGAEHGTYGGEAEIARTD